MVSNIIILIPVFNDYESLNILLDRLPASLKSFTDTKFTVLVADDGSTDPVNIAVPEFLSLQVLHLRRNIGHQKAIAISMAWVCENLECDKLLVMDGDGEDSPGDVARLLQSSITEPDKIIFAARSSRQESRSFRFFYNIYKIVFRTLTGRPITFGNFLVMPKSILVKVVYYSEIWNHVAAGIIKTGLPYLSIPANRSRRYAGISRMNFHSLLMHGLGAITVFIDIIAA